MDEVITWRALFHLSCVIWVYTRMACMLLLTESQWEGSQPRNQPVKVGGSWPCFTTTRGVCLSRPLGSDSTSCLAAEETEESQLQHTGESVWFQMSVVTSCGEKRKHMWNLRERSSEILLMTIIFILIISIIILFYWTQRHLQSKLRKISTKYIQRVNEHKYLWQNLEDKQRKTNPSEVDRREHNRTR